MDNFIVNVLFLTVSVCHLDILVICAASKENFQIKKTHLNKRLIPYTFLEVTVPSHHDCARECFLFGGECKAVNFNRKRKTCELKYKGSNAVDVSEFDQDGEYIFTDITEWPKSMLGGCAAHNCQNHQLCLSLGHSDFQCVDKENCGPAPTIDHGTVSAPITTDGAAATYSCNFGYEIVDDVTTRRCKAGTWTAETIVCALKDCGPLADVTYGTVSAPVTTHGASATYSCQYGYSVTSEDTTRTCVDGIWSGVQPTCTIKDCGPLADVTYGTVSAPVTTHEATATYSCQYGYSVTSGDTTRTCADGIWSGVQPTCTLKDCGPLAEVTYGTVSAPVTTHEASATYSCQYGYSVSSGDTTRTCVDGVWSGVQPTCTIKDCGYLPGITDGSVHTPVTTHGAEAVYDCDFGYQITSGKSTRTCDDGTWSGAEAVCTPIRNVNVFSI
ncbi:CUB and sushi domain-containing protein 3-like [Mercenaria mercenaria]|uniref:CUB and sushi domain-containing protein 3-like n=1 Tax=Mercenaria mercenaria TaxID=6596 RepID=UPI00234E9DF3|nr:CUB and sushi domain-containing protein 3-like [Mercenaria mercenaria]